MVDFCSVTYAQHFFCTYTGPGKGWAAGSHLLCLCLGCVSVDAASHLKTDLMFQIK